MDIVKELRSKKSRDNRDLLDRAADEIESLRKDVERLTQNQLSYNIDAESDLISRSALREEAERLEVFVGGQSVLHREAKRSFVKLINEAAAVKVSVKSCLEKDGEHFYFHIWSNKKPGWRADLTLFSVNSRWLQRVYGMDTHCQMEAFLTNSDSWNSEEIFNAASKEPLLSGLNSSVIRDFPYSGGERSK